MNRKGRADLTRIDWVGSAEPSGAIKPQVVRLANRLRRVSGDLMGGRVIHRNQHDVRMMCRT
ncbi:MAG: hypothetical protein WD906_07835 [Anaerolineales bacterium]